MNEKEVHRKMFIWFGVFSGLSGSLASIMPTTGKAFLIFLAITLGLVSVRQIILELAQALKENT